MLDRYDENLILGYVEEELSPDEQAAFEQLLGEDEQLRTLVQHLIDDRAKLRQVPAVEAPAAILADVSASLEREMLLGKQSSTDNYKFPVWARWTSSIAAMLLLAVGLTYQFDPFGWQAAPVNTTGAGTGTSTDTGTFAAMTPNADTEKNSKVDQQDGNADGINGGSSTKNLAGNQDVQNDETTTALRQQHALITEAANSQDRFVSIELAAADVQSTRDELKLLAAANDAVFISTADQLAMTGRNAVGEEAASLAQDDSYAPARKSYEIPNATAGAPASAPAPAGTPLPAPSGNTNRIGAQSNNEDRVATAKKSEDKKSIAKGEIATNRTAPADVADKTNDKSASKTEVKQEDKKEGKEANHDNAAGSTPAATASANSTAPNTLRPNSPANQPSESKNNPKTDATGDAVVDAGPDPLTDTPKGKPQQRDHFGGDSNSGSSEPFKDATKQMAKSSNSKRAPRPLAIAMKMKDARADNATRQLNQDQHADFINPGNPNALTFAVPADRVEGLIAQLEKKFGPGQVAVQTTDANEFRRSTNIDQAQRGASLSKSNTATDSPTEAKVANPRQPGAAPNAIQKSVPGTLGKPALQTPADSKLAETEAGAIKKQFNATNHSDGTDRTETKAAGDQPSPDKAASDHGLSVESQAGAAKDASNDDNEPASKVTRSGNKAIENTGNEPSPENAKLMQNNRTDRQRDAKQVEKYASKRQVVVSIILKPKADAQSVPEQTDKTDNTDNTQESTKPAAPSQPTK